jgi:hypothetical protein
VPPCRAAGRLCGVRPVIGPAAKAFPDLDFLVYHSGFEFSHFGAPPEGPYTEVRALRL